MLSTPIFELQSIGDDDAQYFRTAHGRTFNTMNPRYLLPVDQDEQRRAMLMHRMVQFMLGGRLYVGPVPHVLQAGKPRRVLDVGTGAGLWGVEMADEFPDAEVIGADLAPIQPHYVPPNCSFELCDVDQWDIPYPTGYFDLVHARFVHTGIQDYPRFLSEVARVLRPGGLLVLIESEPDTFTESTAPGQFVDGARLRGWHTLWETWRSCLRKQHVDATVPQRLHELVRGAGLFDKIVPQQRNVPIGCWPKDPLPLAIGQLSWMAHDLLLPAMAPCFIAAGMSEPMVMRLIKSAQEDLYYPSVHPFARIHIVHATKK